MSKDIRLTAYDLSAGVLRAAEQAFYAELGPDGAHVMRHIHENPNFRRRVANFAIAGGYSPSTDQKLARAILGKNFFGIEDWAVLYGVNFSEKQLRAVVEFPWGEDILNSPCPFIKGKAIRETHVAFLGLDQFMGKPLTIRKWQDIHPATGQPRFYSYPQDCWYEYEKFANEVACAFRWYLMLANIVPKSECTTYADRTVMLPTEYEVPFAIMEVTKDLLYHRKNGFFLNSSRYVRCQDVSSYGDRVGVGDFSSSGLSVDRWTDASRRDHLGLAASRLPAC